MKKLISVLLAILLVVGLTPLSVFADDATNTTNAQFTFSVDPADKTEFVKGDTFKVTLNLANNTGFGAMTLKLKWNENAVKFNGFDTTFFQPMNSYLLDSDILAWYAPQINHEQGTIVCTSTTNITTNGKLFTANFEVIGEGDFDIGLKDGTDFEYIDQSRVTISNEIKADAIEELKAVAAPAVTYGITVNASENGTVTADKQTAAEGEKVTLTVTPADGYMLDTLTYTPAAAEGQTAQAVDIKATKSFTMPSANVTVNATFKAITAGYNVAMGADLTGEKAVTANQPITIPITVGHKAAENQTAETNFKSYELTINYGVGNLKLTNVTSTDSDYSVVNDETTGIAVIRRFGDLINLGDGAINLNFVANKVGTHTVTITDAKVGNSSSAKNDDIPDAEILDASIQIEVGGYNVNLDTNVFEGDKTVDPATDYQFEAKDKNYDYTSVTAYYTDAKGNEQNVNVTDNKDGTYTIAANQIEGDVTIEYTREGKLFEISLGEDMKHNSGTVDVIVDGNTVQKIRYMTDYTAVLEKEDGFTYQVTATKNGETFTDFTYNETTGTVTVEGKFITGDIVFNSGKVSEQPTAYTVTFIGNCKNHASGYASVDPGVDYSFTLNRAPGYTYTISYAVGQVTEETVFTPMDMTGDQTSFTIAKEKITGNLTIKIEGTSDLQVTVNEYVAMSGDQVAYLVTATQTLGEDKTLGYEDGVDEQNNQKYSSMYYRDYTEEVTDEAGQTTSKTVRKYFWLDIQQKPADGEEAAFNAEEAKAKISVLEATSTELTETFNVNQSTSTDINDAQLVYDMYNALYGDFNTVSIMKYLLADLSGDNKLSVQDAAAIVRHIINPDTNQVG